MKKDIKDIAGKVVLVIGGSSPLSKGIVSSFLDEGAVVIVPVKSVNEIDEIRSYKNNNSNCNLITPLTDLPDFDKAIEIVETIVETFGKIDIAVKFWDPSLCSSQLSSMHIDEWLKMTDEDLTPFFITARVVLKLMRERHVGFFVTVTDTPFVNSEHPAPLSAISFSTKMEMSKIFAVEAAKMNVRYYHLGISKLCELRNKTCSKELLGKSVEKIGEQILSLYFKESYNPDEVFQVLEDIEIKNAPVSQLSQ